MVASAAKNSVSRPRLMMPAAASDASSSSPSPLPTPPLACVSRVMKNTSAPTCTRDLQVEVGPPRGGRDEEHYGRQDVPAHP